MHQTSMLVFVIQSAVSLSCEHILLHDKLIVRVYKANLGEDFLTIITRAIVNINMHTVQEGRCPGIGRQKKIFANKKICWIFRVSSKRSTFIYQPTLQRSCCDQNLMIVRVKSTRITPASPILVDLFSLYDALIVVRERHLRDD